MNYFILLLCFALYGNGMFATASTDCCPSEQIILSNMTCTSGKNITALSCEFIETVISNKEAPLLFQLDDDGTLNIAENEDLGVLQINPDNYCLGTDSENGSDVVLLCVYVDVEEEVDVGIRAFSYVRMLCAFISVVFFMGIAAVYIFIPELRDIEGKCIINLSITFGICHVLQCIGPITIAYFGHTCDIFSFTNNFALLCAYNWFTVMSIHIWRIAVRPIFNKQMDWFLIYLCYGYGFPTILLITSLISHLTRQQELLQSIQNHQCWLESSVIVWFYFYGPMTILIIISTIIQLWAAKKLWIDIDRRDQTPDVLRLRKKCLMYLHVLLVIGSLHVLELIETPFQSSEDITIAYVLAILDCRNLLIGGALFFIFVGIRHKVLKALAKHGLCCLNFPAKWKKLIDEEEDEQEMETDEATLTRYNTRL